MTPQIANKQLANDLKTVTHDAEELLKATAGDASEKVKELRGRLGGALQSARATYQDIQGKTLEMARETALTADKVVRSHPYETVGVAFGAGLIIGVLAGRR